MAAPAIDFDAIKFGHLIGRSKPMQELYHLIEKVAPTRATVLVTGESGTGKELVAQTLHDMSERANKPFIAINCGAITTELIGSALFGHERGSFTGANQAHQGYFEQASGGTLFLDELPETNPELQVRLLRVLETSKIIPVGGKRQISVDVRVIAATNRDPLEAVNAGILREDLYYRLNTFPIHIPPLRERDDDIETLAQFFLHKLNLESRSAITISSQALQALHNHNWPGNVRELRNVIQRAFILADKIIEIEHIGNQFSKVPSGKDSVMHLPLGKKLADIDKQYVQATLEFCKNDKKQAAAMLNITAKALDGYL